MSGRVMRSKRPVGICDKLSHFCGAVRLAIQLRYRVAKAFCVILLSARKPTVEIE